MERIKGYLSCIFSGWPGSSSGWGSGRKITRGMVRPHLTEYRRSCGILNTTRLWDAGMWAKSPSLPEWERDRRYWEKGRVRPLWWALIVENPELQLVSPLQWTELAQSWWVPVSLCYSGLEVALWLGAVWFGDRVLLPGIVRLLILQRNICKKGNVVLTIRNRQNQLTDEAKVCTIFHLSSRTWRVV